ncbi:hypothetical protein [Pseudosulfitobacter koreensis]|uniref:Uncharacterized protein n=1 Tax=Pseudosulfitobacter koreensis TaxID=2968472 RepID=A0ABT1YZ85_9RHOB|nr:hypothetical protein [Pseudosulfitobacter koreense]MCR8826188.1 hypothetical protein [Pseudosulfitobacter koreense]
MVKSRAQNDIGPSTNGLALPDEATLPYPLRVQAIYVSAGDYVKPETHPVYTLMDSAGAQHTYCFDLAGQVTEVLVRPGQIFRKPTRVFAFCCDTTAKAFAADVAPSRVKPLSAPPLTPRAVPSRPAAANTRRASNGPSDGQSATWGGPRKQTLALGGVAALVAGLMLLSQGKLWATGDTSPAEAVAEQPAETAPAAINAVVE